MILSENLIFHGPHKRMNNLLKTFKKDNQVALNKNQYCFSYIVQFDKFGEKVLNDLLKEKNKKQKIIIGPLYNLDNLKSLSAKVKTNKQIKILAASKIAQSNLLKELDLDIAYDDTVVCPGGVISKKELLENAKISNRIDKCLIYFKKRNAKDLDYVKHCLDNRNIKYETFEYGKYKNKDLLEASKKYKFGIIIGTTESQGFGIQEILSCNLPVIVLNSNVNNFEGYTLNGTTVPYWSNDCGVIIDNLDEFNLIFDNFYKNLKKYQPHKLIQKYLTFEKSREKLFSLYGTIND